mmetsp:Transcript_29057/g.92982  ORF Transcript_29057/g.92982 Transcript_29057/m.92982 type:complete len:221 (-) Transcript_29057:224-886(-)
MILFPPSMPQMPSPKNLLSRGTLCSTLGSTAAPPPGTSAKGMDSLTSSECPRIPVPSKSVPLCTKSPWVKKDESWSCRRMVLPRSNSGPDGTGVGTGVGAATGAGVPDTGAGDGGVVPATATASPSVGAATTGAGVPGVGANTGADDGGVVPTAVTASPTVGADTVCIAGAAVSLSEKSGTSVLSTSSCCGARFPNAWYECPTTPIAAMTVRHAKKTPPR